MGSDADPTIVNLSLEKTVTPEMLEGYCDDSIRDSWKVTGWPVMTILTGDNHPKKKKIGRLS